MINSRKQTNETSSQSMSHDDSYGYAMFLVVQALDYEGSELKNTRVFGSYESAMEHVDVLRNSGSEGCYDYIQLAGVRDDGSVDEASIEEFEVK